jgi:tetratricopeptide (TPR) repeat protein
MLVLAAGTAMAADGRLASAPRSQAAQAQAVQKDPLPADANLAARVRDYVSKQLWKSRISTLPSEPTGQDKEELGQLIERLKAAESRAKPRDRAQADPAGVQRAPEPNAVPAGQVAPSPAPSPVKAPTPDANSARLPALVLPDGADPNTVTDPLKMAEILYATGLRAKAAPFYQKALAQVDAQDKKKASERQWILLQLGRCWLEDQPAQARQMFSQLISEYPDSPWLDVARTWQGLTDWYLTEQPRQLIQRTPSPAPQAGAKAQPASQP